MRPVMERWSPGFRELLKDGSRDNSIGIEDVNLETTDLETAFPPTPRHPEQFLLVRPSVEKRGCLAALFASVRMPGRPRGLEQVRATLPRIYKARYDSDIKRHPQQN
jgi:hypothetical protein